jgi:hypothetical protein
LHSCAEILFDGMAGRVKFESEIVYHTEYIYDLITGGLADITVIFVGRVV